MPRVSVIIPVYNGEAFLAEAIESVLAQDAPDFDVIVADDGSTDNSRAVAASFRAVRLLELEHRGVSHARNCAIRSTGADWIAFLDADDAWLPGRLTAQIAAAERHPEAGILFTHARYEVVQPPPSWYRGVDDGTEQPTFEPSTWLVRRSLFDEIGYFDEQRDLAEDTDWLARARDARVEEVMVAKTLVRRRIHGGNAVRNARGIRVGLVSVLRDSVARKKAALDGER